MSGGRGSRKAEGKGGGRRGEGRGGGKGGGGEGGGEGEEGGGEEGGGGGGRGGGREEGGGGGGGGRGGRGGRWGGGSVTDLRYDGIDLHRWVDVISGARVLRRLIERGPVQPHNFFPSQRVCGSPAHGLNIDYERPRRCAPKKIVDDQCAIRQRTQLKSRSRRQIRPRRATRIWLSRNAFKANRPCGKNSSTNGRRFCRPKNPIASVPKRGEWRATPILSVSQNGKRRPAAQSGQVATADFSRFSICKIAH